MICPDCQKGVVLVLRGQGQGQVRPYGGITFLANPEKYFRKVLCTRCNGSGIAYCRDGEEYNAECYSDAGHGNRTGIGQDRSMV